MHSTAIICYWCFCLLALLANASDCYGDNDCINDTASGNFHCTAGVCTQCRVNCDCAPGKYCIKATGMCADLEKMGAVCSASQDIKPTDALYCGTVDWRGSCVNGICTACSYDEISWTLAIVGNFLIPLSIDEAGNPVRVPRTQMTTPATTVDTLICGGGTRRCDMRTGTIISTTIATIPTTGVDSQKHITAILGLVALIACMGCITTMCELQRRRRHEEEYDDDDDDDDGKKDAEEKTDKRKDSIKNA
jgi:hypothetical protein